MRGHLDTKVREGHDLFDNRWSLHRSGDLGIVSVLVFLVDRVRPNVCATQLNLYRRHWRESSSFETSAAPSA